MKPAERKALTFQLIAKWQREGDVEARNEAVELNQGLVINHVNALIPHIYIERSDDLQQGYLGLMHTCDKFDLEAGFAFSSYAMPWIKHYIQYHRLKNHAPCHPATDLLKAGEQTRMMWSMDYRIHRNDDDLAGATFGDLVPDESIHTPEALCHDYPEPTITPQSGHQYVLWNYQSKSWRVIIKGKYIRQSKKLDKAVKYRDEYLEET